MIRQSNTFYQIAETEKQMIGTWEEYEKLPIKYGILQPVISMF